MVTERFLAECARIVGSAGLVRDAADAMTYECDALAHLRVTPAAVLLPASAQAVQSLVQLCVRENVAFVARGHGTGLSGGATPVEGGVVISLAIDPDHTHLDATVDGVAVRRWVVGA